jgi:hypothetical protein
MADPNLAILTAMVRAMGPLRDHVVFVGGCATGLLLTQSAVTQVRPTEDVDAIVEVVTLADYYNFTQQLADRGFRQTMADNTPPFRWFWNRMQLDLVPLDDNVLGFANPWYRPGFEAAEAAEIAEGLVLKHLTAPYFLATKFEAFKDRGQSDVYVSHDLEDIITVVDGRASVPDELAGAPDTVRHHVVQNIRALLAHPGFLNALPGIVAFAPRAVVVLRRLQQIAALNTP